TRKARQTDTEKPIAARFQASTPSGNSQMTYQGVTTGLKIRTAPSARVAALKKVSGSALSRRYKNKIVSAIRIAHVIRASRSGISDANSRNSPLLNCHFPENASRPSKRWEPAPRYGTKQAMQTITTR